MNQCAVSVIKRLFINLLYIRICYLVKQGGAFRALSSAAQGALISTDPSMSPRGKNEPLPRSAVRTSYLLYHAWFAMRNRVDEALKPYGLTSMQYTLLSTLAARKNLSSAQLSRRFYITPQAMGQVLNQLEAAGWLTRTPDPENHRVLQVNLTKAGRERVSMCDAEMNLIEDKAFARIDRSTLAAMRTGLESMMVSMRGERG